MAKRTLLKSKNSMKFELELPEIGCIKAFLLDYSKTVNIWGNEISGMTDWQAEILHTLASEFEAAETELDNYISKKFPNRGTN